MVKTKSEDVFESFLAQNDLAFKKIEVDTSVAGQFRPDYLVQTGDSELIFEVKELTADENFGIGDHVRRMIQRSKRQIQYGANRGIPSILLIYNLIDPAFQMWRTDDLDWMPCAWSASFRRPLCGSVKCCTE